VLTACSSIERKLVLHQPPITTLNEHPFAQGFDPIHFDTLEQCARPCTITAGSYVWRQGEQADFLLLICSGQVTLEIAVPLHAPVAIDTVGEGDIVGWSWLVPPYRWHFDARAITPVRGFRLDIRVLRDRCELDPAFGYQVLKRFTPVIVRRLESAQTRLLQL
jgi:CRP-like cAMP-binding protein